MVGEGGGSSIRVGTTGKISVLMTRELESTRCESSETPVSCRRKCQTGPVSVSCGTYARRQHRRTTGNGKSSGGSPRSSSQGSHGSAHRKTCNSRLPACRVPILSSDEVSFDRTPDRNGPGKKGSCVVEIVDLNCGNPERGWSSPMANRLKKLGFSRLSQTIN